MKLYRLKEEVKKYIKFGHDMHSPLESWESEGVNLEALEEVESKIEIKLHRGNDDYWLFKIKNGIKIMWNEQEREFIEFCLNKLKSKENINENLLQYIKSKGIADTMLGKTNMDFTDWLKFK